MMTYHIQRTFHPIGQGAFYSERHDDFNIVYDCGARPLSPYAKSLVQSVFTASDKIDVLFISHFDYDHVSAISLLMRKVKKIKKVVLPLLHDEHKNLLININRAMSQNIIKLLKDPQSFFGEDTDIVYVNPASPQEENDDNEGEEKRLLDLKEIRHMQDPLSGKIEIKSGSKLRLGAELSWVFVPYNFCNKKRSIQLESELESEGFCVTQLKNDPIYSLKAFSTPASRRVLREIYTRVDGNVNENSLLLYSGPDTSFNKDELLHCYVEIGWPDFWFHRTNSGCIYTGDADLNKISLNTEYSEYIESVGVIQVPHHGSRHNFTIEAFEGFWPHIVCPVSCGEQNQYGHPASEVINQLALRLFTPLIVTEQPETEFIQHIFFINKRAESLQKTVGKF